MACLAMPAFFRAMATLAVLVAVASASRARYAEEASDDKVAASDTAGASLGSCKSALNSTESPFSNFQLVYKAFGDENGGGNCMDLSLISLGWLACKGAQSKANLWPWISLDRVHEKCKGIWCTQGKLPGHYTLVCQTTAPSSATSEPASRALLIDMSLGQFNSTYNGRLVMDFRSSAALKGVVPAGDVRTVAADDSYSLQAWLKADCGGKDSVFRKETPTALLAVEGCTCATVNRQLAKLK